LAKGGYLPVTAGTKIGIWETRGRCPRHQNVDRTKAFEHGQMTRETPAGSPVSPRKSAVLEKPVGKPWEPK